MKNTFWHFGDSFAFSGNNPESFGLLLSRKFNMSYEFHAVSGSANQMIFSNILKNDSNYKPGDIIFINWSFFHRGCYVGDNHDIKSTNEFFNENVNEITKSSSNYSDFIKKNSFILDYTLNFSYDLNVKLFNGLVYPYFSALKKRGISVYNLFIRDDEPVSHEELIINDIMNIIKIDNNIKFEPTYYEWLINNEYFHNGDEGHYSHGIQPILANEIFERIQNLFK